MHNQIVIGKIVAPHGVRGDIRILPLTEKPEQFLDVEYLLLSDAHDHSRNHRKVEDAARGEDAQDMGRKRRTKGDYRDTECRTANPANHQGCGFYQLWHRLHARIEENIYHRALS